MGKTAWSPYDLEKQAWEKIFFPLKLAIMVDTLFWKIMGTSMAG
jgi:hypothetical protein